MLILSASEAEGLARSFTSVYPHFTKTMKRFNVSGSYTLVSTFLVCSLCLFKGPSGVPRISLTLKSISILLRYEKFGNIWMLSISILLRLFFSFGHFLPFFLLIKQPLMV